MARDADLDIAKSQFPVTISLHSRSRVVLIENQQRSANMQTSNTSRIRQNLSDLSSSVLSSIVCCHN
jgi:hypothetical protein